MKRIFIIICFLSVVIITNSNAQVAQIATNIENQSMGTKNYVQLIVKNSNKDLKISSIEVNSADDAVSKSYLTSVFELITKLRSSLNNKSVIMILNEMSFQGYNLVSSTAANNGVETETIYTLCKIVQ